MEVRYNNGLWTGGRFGQLHRQQRDPCPKSRALKCMSRHAFQSSQSSSTPDTLPLCEPASLSSPIPPTLLGRVLTENYGRRCIECHHTPSIARNTRQVGRHVREVSTTFSSIPLMAATCMGPTFFRLLFLLFLFSRADIGSLGAELEIGKSFNNGRQELDRLPKSTLTSKVLDCFGLERATYRATRRNGCPWICVQCRISGVSRTWKDPRFAFGCFQVVP